MHLQDCLFGVDFAPGIERNRGQRGTLVDGVFLSAVDTARRSEQKAPDAIAATDLADGAHGLGIDGEGEIGIQGAGRIPDDGAQVDDRIHTVDGANHGLYRPEVANHELETGIAIVLADGMVAEHQTIDDADAIAFG